MNSSFCNPGRFGARKGAGFKLKLAAAGLALWCGSAGAAGAETFRPIPEPVRTAIQARGEDWTGDLIAVQTWGQPEYNLVTKAGQWLPLLRDGLKVNAVCFRPPAVFNHHRRGMSPPGHQHTPPEEYFNSEEAFAAAHRLYRASGIRLILYTGLVNLGHAPQWDDGTLQREHPDWLQRGADGGTVSHFGNLWFCPNSGALDYVIDYSRRLLERYRPDALMFDNNFYHNANSGEAAERTCYCVNCEAKFAAYVAERFAGRTEELFQLKPAEIRIPRREGLLWNVWLDWRNRSWADAMRRIRRELPCVVFANTEFMWDDWTLGVDRVFAEENAVFSETDNLATLSEKLAVGNSFAPDRPVFNYLIAFETEKEAFWNLRPEAEIANLIGYVLAYKNNPWLMFHGWDPELGYPEPVGDANAAGQALIKRFFQFRHDRGEWFREMQPASDAGIVYASRNRLYGEQRQDTAALRYLLRQGYPVRVIYDLNLADGTGLERLNVLVADHLRFLSDEEAAQLAAFLRRGGTILATADLGECDQFGRIRPVPAVMAALQRQPDGEELAGRIDDYRVPADLPELLDGTSEWGLPETAAVAFELVPWQLPDGRWLLHGVRRLNGSDGAAELRLPRRLAGQALAVRLHSPFGAEVLELPLEDGVVKLPQVPYYFVLEVCPAEAATR